MTIQRRHGSFPVDRARLHKGSKLIASLSRLCCIHHSCQTLMCVVLACPRVARNLPRECVDVSLSCHSFPSMVKSCSPFYFIACFRTVHMKDWIISNLARALSRGILNLIVMTLINYGWEWLNFETSATLLYQVELQEPCVDLRRTQILVQSFVFLFAILQT